MVTTFIYISIFITTGILTEISSRLSEKNQINRIFKYSFTLISLFIPAFFAGIRYGIGTDYFNYVKIFNIATFNNETRTEAGYNLINIVVKELGGNEHMLFFVVSFLTWFIIYQFLYSYRKNLSVGLGMFIALLLFYNYSFNIVRQLLAMAITLHSFKYIDQKKWKNFLFTSLLALSMHSASIITIPFYYLFNNLGNKRLIYKIIIYLCVFFLIGSYSSIVEFMSVNIFNDTYYLLYAQKGETQFGLGVFIISAPYLLPGIIFYKRLKNKNKSFDLFLFLTIISFILTLVGYFGVPALNRISLLFNSAAIWLVPYYYSEFKNEKKWFWVPLMSVIGIIVYWYFSFIVANGAETTPYITIF